MNKHQEHESAEKVKADRHALIQSLGLEYKAAFVPFSQSRNATKDHKSLNWLITLSKGRRSLTTDYMQGIAHLKGFKQKYGAGLSVDEAAALTRSVESGVTFSFSSLFSAKQPAPELTDVLYSLVLDSEVLDSPTFEEWAGNYGYDADSRNAEKIYKACMENAITLRAMIGDAHLTKLRELFQDY